MPLDVAIAVENSDAVRGSDFNEIKRFVKKLIRRLSSSENNNHFALLEYGENATILTDFRKYRDQRFLEDLIDNVTKREVSQRRVDIALESIKENIFSLKGGMRQVPRYLIFVASDESTADFNVFEGAGKELGTLGVTFVAIGTKRAVPGEFLQKLSGYNSLVYKADVPNELSGLVLDDLIYKMCVGKYSKFIGPRPRTMLCALSTSA